MPVSIRSRLLLLVLSVLLPSVLAALWIISRTYDAEQQALERNLRETTRALATVVGGELAQRAAIARVLSYSRNLDLAPGVSAPALALFDQQARQAMSGLEGWVELRSRSQLLLSTRLPTSAIQTPLPLDSAFVEVPTVGPLEAARGGGELRATLIQPVQRNGRTELNLAVTILPAELQRIIDGQHMPQEATTTVLDHRQTVVARYPGGTANAGRSATPDMRDLLTREREGVFESTNLDGIHVTGYFSSSDQGWTFLTALPRTQFIRGIPNGVLQTALGALAVLALAVLGALWVARRIVDPVMSLKRAAARLQAGLPVERRPTGIVECDEVNSALAEAADSIRGARDDLERQVGSAVARTREAEQRASHSQRVEALGRLTGGVAHDFNNLLGIISNSAHLIQRQAQGPALQVPVAATLRAVEVGSRLTQHLLRFARRQPVRPQSLNLQRYLPDVEELVQTVLGRHIQASTSVAADTLPITVDSSELELAIINLALNARDAMPAGGRLRIQARNAAAGDELSGLAARPYVMITVGDDGLGMDESLAERAFEPFFTTKDVGKGTGLGLSQVHGFCAQAGGAARLQTTPGLGTTVTMILPASTAADRDPATSPRRPASVAGVRALLVEDNEELGDVTTALLASFGCQVQRARNAGEALRLLDSGVPVDVVLSDIVMPGAMDGVGLARELRERWPELPVVLISGYSTAQIGASEFVVLQKPCAPEDLVAALQQAIASRRRG